MKVRERLKTRIFELIAFVNEEAVRRREQIQASLPVHGTSATNLAHYIGVRKHDVRRLQLELASLALSSLGRCEGHVMDTLIRLAGWLDKEQSQDSSASLDWSLAESILHRNTRALFGPRPSERHVYIMVTAPDAVEATADWADGILRAGADLLRINGAHQTPAEWVDIITVFRARARELGRPVRVFVDLPGPKLRAETRASEPAVLHLPRDKDWKGHTVKPTSMLLVAEYDEGAQIPLPRQWLDLIHPGDRIRLEDAGGRSRELIVHGRATGGIRAECDQSLYLMAGLRLEWYRNGLLQGQGVVGEFSGTMRDLSLSQGEAFMLNSDGRRSDLVSAVLVCPEPEILAAVKTGERVVLDDGKLIAVVEAVVAEGLQCRVTRALKSPLRLRSGKGIAFPDSALSLRALGPQDELALAFALQHADGVEASFVNQPQDVRLLSDKLRAAEKAGFGMVLKLETRQAMRNLPEILFEALRYDPVGLMIARGDLAVELSFERLAEMQEELLWFGEACHLPVIWATQVLDSLAHSGVPTRAEVTDAAMSMRAECVMLNKGPQLAAAVRMLADIIRKMEAHQYKKRSIYRPLQVALGLSKGETAETPPGPAA
ncbi:MAG: pyruvate kinase [Steroidobacterales bacterium]